MFTRLSNTPIWRYEIWLSSQERPHAMAVLLSAGPAGSKWMEVGTPHTLLPDLTGPLSDPITTNGAGWAEFHCQGGSVSAWVEEAGLPQD